MNIYGLGKGAKVHFIGIGGISMSSLSVILNNWGYKVSGSDIRETDLTKKLISQGITVFYGQGKENIKDYDLIVYTAAIKEDNTEFIAAKESKALLKERSEFLGEIMGFYKEVCCVTGTHGKTTTTSMVSLIMDKTDLAPTILNGAEVKELGGNYKIGKNNLMIAEACEYVESFLKFRPTSAIILNIDEDHLDYYKNLEHIISAFRKFANLLNENNVLVVNGEDENVLSAINETKAKIITYGFSDKFDYYPSDIVYNNKGCASYKLMHKGISLGEISLNVPGKHNILNSISASALCLYYGCDFKLIKEGLADFIGADRRFEYLGQYKNATIIDDYAHHPTEIEATLNTAKNIKHNKIYAIFQPHTYTRTKLLLEEFSNAFYNADKVIVTDIYAAREIDDHSIHSKDLVCKLVSNKVDAIYMESFEEITDYIKKNAAPDDIFITIGAGDVYKISKGIFIS